ncbi:MAG: N-6 DNA methylase [Lachnospiraceae bacterium]|nr:N-6 DNA methylase [Lachnospiraceae bacterium]
MNAKNIIKILKGYCNHSLEIERMIVYAFVQKEKIDYSKSKILNNYLAELDSDLYIKSVNFFDKFNIDLTLDFLVELFEQIVPETEKKEKGIVYTPVEIKEYIVSQVCRSNNAPTVIDPSCGCGSFLVTAAQYIHQKYGINYSEIISQKIYGIDIDEDAIKKAKILLTLLASSNKEYGDITFNFLCSNALDPKTIRKAKKWQPKGFDCVIGNPPYVRFRNMANDSKALLNNWITANTGNIDLYMPFFEIGMTLLKEGAVLSYITPNSYIQAINGRKLREYLSDLAYSLTILDFRDAQVFKNVTSYTCITTIDSAITDKVIKYVRIDNQESLNSHNYSEYKTTSFSNGAPWRMRKHDVDSIIKKLESSGTPLSKWKIRNGLATLKNDIYFFTPFKEDDKYFYRIYAGVEYRIEREICIKVAKPNIIKTEEDLKTKTEVAIFPYTRKNNIFDVIEEKEMLSKYPMTYRFLFDNRNILNQRDKGNGNYPVWYAYGRTQGMNNFGKKLLIPYISDKPIAVLSLEEKMLFYCGYALISDDEQELKLLKCFLESDAFWYYIYHTSKPYSKGYMALAKNYLINFTIPNLTEKEKQYLLSNQSKKEINKWIWNKYGIAKD